MTYPQIGYPDVSTETLGMDISDVPITINYPSFEPPQLQAQQVANPELIIPDCFPRASVYVIKQQIAQVDGDLRQQILDEVAENYRLNPTKTIPLRLLRCFVALSKKGQFYPELCFQYADRRAATTINASCEKIQKPIKRTPVQVESDRSACLAAVGLKII
ncbi:hypothetical protein HQ393_10075 [Chitinibacter bivalviorum]|uniref:Uncharacterized protein n=1 Tax=Chitinibacter bivalviorum TaxID=2739434 RepID=A0A7H9BKM0_9NEIS|nr:hypothetical protein [Chitinibacter bivalviorum]QLG88561.1 hypothetical protein HQ393_10075 [Chitinibacter bivalviorum]